MMTIEQAAVEAYLARLSGTPVQIERMQALGGADGAAALKAFGYGRPMRIDYRPRAPEPAGELRRVVLRQVNRNGFGRERDDDRVAEVWLDFHTFNRLPSHVAAWDMLTLTDEGALESAGHLQELFLLTEYAPGQVYADDLARIRDAGACTDEDRARTRALAAYLAGIHAVKHDDPLLWRRRLRDLIGHGEGILGLTDSYPPADPLAPAHMLRRIEEAANAWRWRLKPLTQRLSQVHGDFHPFNVLFTAGESFVVLDRSRGEWGEPADDVSCMAINYLFFSLQRYGELAGPFLDLHHTFWTNYLERSHDQAIATVVQPWFAWRALVLASPQWYPNLTEDVRRKLLTFARRVLAAPRIVWQELNHYLEA